MEPTPLKQVIDLKGKSAIVTGGAMGIGFGIAWRLAEAGAGVTIADMNLSAAEEAAAKLRARGWKATAVHTDVANPADVHQMVETAVKAFGGVDILVNDAGIYPSVPVMQLAVKDFERILDINLKGVFLCTQAAAAQMIMQGRGGKIINITSVDAVHPSSVGLATYDASKHGVWGFTKNVALELAPHRIWVNAIAPGGVNTPGTGAGAPVSKELQEITRSFQARIPMHRMGEPDDIGKVALFLASDLASYMTGAQVVVDGGVLLS
ncbi:MAG TPA: SDR family NAD(P)-dependent oxidoreductase [Candidatus Limnocylindrales bacterium]|nr:SDR family NAD(P)-dependent oxidoreductase [Candidatus Limnocylindrales bacterium]